MSCYLWPILTPLPCHTLSHIPGPPKSTSHISDPPIFLVGLVQKIRTKAPCTNFLSIVGGGFVRGTCQRVFCLEGFVRSGFCPFLLLSQYICYKRNLNITLNFMFNMYVKKCISVTSHALVTNCHTYSDPLPLERDVGYFVDGPWLIMQKCIAFKIFMLMRYFFVGRGGALVYSTPFARRVAGLNPALAAM